MVQIETEHELDILLMPAREWTVGAALAEPEEESKQELDGGEVGEEKDLPGNSAWDLRADGRRFDEDEEEEESGDSDSNDEEFEYDDDDEDLDDDLDEEEDDDLDEEEESDED